MHFCIDSSRNGGADKSKQEVEAEEGYFGGGLRLGYKVEETQVREERGREELGGYTLGINGGCPWIHRQKPTTNSLSRRRRRGRS